ncbi:MAG: chromosome partitioning protein [Microbacterium sp. SCN 70-200]|uniref:polysaccharide biosynthesis tyrosine autokinase n=1 Tax=unclassified Microbacterium TaxID=2609290 RepID=UPI000868EBDB|nr:MULTISPECIES: polysaccharide biosynthesis tyrosine autokinase [unclassified Microbacterium]MBN9216090.1 polysaccharide biosynthesis tyrosine autokinase [Microbacterium sp.]ODT39829.1 MAG: chromosome partitioning protein [Microbacterium sp. SCN 70-200]OJV80568.1 MAG: chromosome partitioning protein [Microbacterium sp. 70-16]
MELSDYLRILRKNWLVIVVLTLVGLGAAAAYSLTRTPEFESSSTVFVSTQGSTVQELQQGSSFTQARINTYVGLATAPVVLNPVIAELGLDVTARTLAESVSVAAPLNSTLITVTVTDPDPVMAADIANAIAASLATAVPQLEPESADGTSPVRLTRVSDAQPALSPSSPNVPLNLALGVLVGLALGIGVAVLRTVLDNKVRNPRDAEQITAAPSIGAIAYDPKAKDRPLIVHADPLSPRAESFRALRTNLQFLDMGGRASFVITSSIPSEGKSTTTINLAIALADAGKRVALLDTDLRKPKVAEYLGIEGGVGLTDVLIGRARVGDVMLPWGGRSLFVLPAGKVPPNPSELLGSDQMATLLEVLERDFDVVLCDAPPLLPVTDAAILARATSGALLIIAAGKTTKHQLTGAAEALQTVGAKLAGFVMSMVPTRGADSYYSAYGYGYGYGYGAYTQEKPKGKAKKAKDGAAARRTTPVAAVPHEPSMSELGFETRRDAREADRSS